MSMHSPKTMQYLIILAFLTTAIIANKPKRTDDANNVAALETLLQKQAVVMQSLEARLTAQDAKLLQQTVSIHSLQAELATQQNTIDNLLANSQSLDQKLERDNLTLVHRLDMMENVQLQQAASVQSQQTALQQQETALQHQASVQQQQETTLQQHASVQQQQGATLQTVVKEQQSMGVTIAKQEQAAGFYADFGYAPYHHVTNATGETLKFPRVLTNTGNGYNNNTGIFTTPFSGLYTFQLHFIGGVHNDSTELSIYAAGHNVAIAYAEGDNVDNDDQGSCTAVVRLVTGDQVRVRFYSGTPKIWGSGLSSFSGVLVQSD